jgi:Sec-independent protein translocase protein TatA
MLLHVTPREKLKEVPLAPWKGPGAVCEVGRGVGGLRGALGTAWTWSVQAPHRREEEHEKKKTKKKKKKTKKNKKKKKMMKPTTTRPDNDYLHAPAFRPGEFTLNMVQQHGKARRCTVLGRTIAMKPAGSEPCPRGCKKEVMWRRRPFRACL